MVREHSAMLNCKHDEADQLGPVCLHCGRVDLPDPSWLVVLFAAVFFTAHIAWWILL